MLAFIGGLFVGGFFGVAIMCVLSVAGNNDCDFDDTIIQYDGSDAKEDTKTNKE